MATTARDFRSPFNNVLSSLPQGHDKAFKQALYTTAANLFVLFAFAAAIALYFILEAFLRPLLWAVLCGTFLYPFKRSLTNSLRQWLIGLQKSGTPFIIGVVTIPVHTVDKTYETISFEFTKHAKLIFSAICGILCLYFLWHFGPVKLIFAGFQSSFMFVYELLGYFTSFWVWTIIVGYILAVAFLWTPDFRKYLRYLSFPVWIVIIFHIATVAGFLRVPLLMFLVVVVTIGFIAEVKEARKQKELQGKTMSPSAVEAAWMVLTGESESIKEETDTTETEGDLSEQKEESPKSTSDAEKKPDTFTKDKEIQKPTSLPVRKPITPFKISTADVKTTTTAAEATKKAEMEQKPKLSPLHTPTNTSSDKTKVVRSLSDQCFIALFWVLILSRLWMHIWIVQLLLPLGFLLWLVKFLGYRIGSLGERFQSVKDKVWSWLYERRDAFAPRWIRGLIKMISQGDKKLISILEQSLDQATSVLFILILLVGTLIFTVIFAVQVQQESMHLVKMTSNLLNNTLHPEMSQWLPNGDVVQDAMDSMVGNAYLYGRNWIASKVRDMVNGQSNNTNIETQVLDVWDRLYENWLARISDTRLWLYKANATSSSGSVATRSFQIIPDDLLSFDSIYEIVTKGDAFNVSQIVAFVKDNLETFTSVFESVWTILKGNMNLVLSLVTATLSLVLGGGTALLNFVISSIIFLTTLFYLLASSGKQYKPMELLTTISPTKSGGGFSQAVEEAISGVFMASLKMAAFYGLYTYLTHTIFSVDIVFIPCALAAIFGAIPFLGTYWAAIPAVLELWLVRGEGLWSLVLLGFHMLPAYVVDTAIYSEIKGGHPYMTGLAIAGGIYWMGLEGAIIAPILLCCLIVAVNLYGTMLQPDSETPVGLSPKEDGTGLWKTRSSIPSLFQRSYSSYDVVKK